MHGWHYTPGWGALGTVTVAIIALIASATFNVITLRRASRQAREGRRDARNDRLRGEVAGLFNALAERQGKHMIMAHRLREFANSAPVTGTPAQISIFQSSVTTSYRELVDAPYREIVTRCFAVSLVTKDDNLVGLTDSLRKIIESERKQYESLIESSVSEHGDLQKIRQRIFERADAIEGARDLIAEYCLKHLPDDDAYPAIPLRK
jgi:hypothetical protein